MNADGIFDGMGQRDRGHQESNGYDASWLQRQELDRAHLREVGRDPPPLDVQERIAAEERARAGIDPPPLRTSQWRCAADLEGLPVPEREWLVPDLIPARNVTLLYGDGGTGKSLLALQLAVSVALGRPWLGQPVKPGRALFPSAEDEEPELHRRLADIVRHAGARLGDLSGLTYRSLIGEDAMLARLGEFGRLTSSDLYEELDRLMAAHRPAVTVLDTLADMFPGNENDKAQARAFVGMLKRLAIKHDCAVVMLAHPSLSGMSSGSGSSGNVAWNGSARARLYLERIISEGYEADPDARVLRTMKANYGPRGGEIGMTWRDGVFVAAAAATGLDRAAGNAKAERVFLSLLRAFTEQGRCVNSAGGLNYAPKLFAEHPHAEGLTRRAFRAAMETLLAQGRIIVRQKGPASRPTTFIAEAAE